MGWLVVERGLTSRRGKSLYSVPVRPDQLLRPVQPSFQLMSNVCPRR